VTVHDATVDPLTAWANDAVWRRKMGSDADRIRRCLPPELCGLHNAVVERSRSAAAQALILSGSTVRGRRTEISDLDYHLVGPRIETKDLSSEVDLHVLSEQKLESELLAGDDFVHWSLRFGCVVFDDGTVRQALRLLVERQPWPDVDRKCAHAAKSLELARRFVATGDEDGALEQVRTALSLVARARLLGEGVFPLSRAELPAQLDSIGCGDSARALAATIHASPSLPELAEAVRQGEELLVRSRSSTTCVAPPKEPQSVADGAVRSR
jgi:hypothetical protein